MLGERAIERLKAADVPRAPVKDLEALAVWALGQNLPIVKNDPHVRCEQFIQWLPDGGAGTQHKRKHMGPPGFEPGTNRL